MSDDVRAWLSSIGLMTPDVVLDGKVHRVDGKKRGKKAGWYIGWTKPMLICVAGDWTTGERHEWREGGGKLSEEQRRQVRALQKEAARHAEDERRGRQSEVAQRVVGILARAAGAPRTHSYLEAKQVEAHAGVYVSRNELLIPNRDVDGNVWGAQRITASGSKLWFEGQRVSETFFQIGELGGIAYICEGYATGATIHEVTGHAVFAAFAANNLKSVARALHKAWPGVRWIIAGDNDRGPTNPGRDAAEAAAKAIDAEFVLPTFGRADATGTDFNDLMQVEGRAAVAKQLDLTERAMAEVTDLGVERKRRRRASEMSTSDMHHCIALAMARSPEAPPDWPPFPRSFHVVVDESGSATLLEEMTPGVVRYRVEGVLPKAIIRYCYGELRAIPGSSLSYKSAVACANLWLGIVKPLDAPPPALVERSAPGLAFRRLPFDAPPQWDGPPPPLFEEFLSRCSKPLELCAFIGSLFYPEADRQQYLYIYGHGLDGKGSLLRLLFSLLGPAAQSLQPKTRDDRFWNMKVYGKRLVMLPDCEDFRFFASPEFKSLTGNDPLFFEEKGKPGFSAVPTCKIIAASNHKPNITSQKSDLRRLIYVEVKTAPPHMLAADYEQRLAGEAEAIVRICKEIYLQKCPAHGPIPCDYSDDVAVEAESEFLDLFHALFALAPEASLPGGEVRSMLRQHGIKSNHTMKAIKDCWERQLGIVIRHSKRGAAYVGMRTRAFVTNGGGS